ncbi:quinone-dependent dihydroorotate dehydrogenase [Lujinxingia vulgaris]|uniref:quinone-dependent dihydroorotate dehydrogenase n=1 Tax=Lujinxingia vulgaris TaxID=2600176 RepID=UPI001E2DD3D1|nr:quinone-dependent dihydroorotate dehydrogenase [Lujinxingia vulgaris]
MYRALRGAMFRLEPERAHHLAMGALAAVTASAATRELLRGAVGVNDPRLKQEVWGLGFENPVGLAAGFDKDARWVNALGALGFGHVEVGTVTALAQAGNARPRLFRLVDDRGLLNRMGFNNAGSEAVARRLKGVKVEPVLGVNIGKSKVTPLEDAAEDYATTLRRLHDFADYIVVNVSSPNTPGLRSLQGRGPLEGLLRRLKALNLELSEGTRRRPLLVKVSPDLGDQALDEVVEVVEAVGLDGIVATNTTVSRQGLRSAGVEAMGAGGVSGRPVRSRSLEVIGRIYARSQGRVPIVGVGGIFGAEDALAALEAGASLVQVWTGFVYEGPLVVRRINRGLLRLMEARGYAEVGEAVGAAHRR